MDSYTVTTLVGGAQGDFFSDILKLTDTKGQLIVDRQNSIRRIDVVYGSAFNVVEGLGVWYKPQNGDDQVFVEHGSPLTEANQSSSVKLADTEVLLAVFGRAGFHPYYRGDLIINIGFVIIDKVSLAVRVEGPFGDKDSPREPFYVTDVMAFGGYASAQSRLSGLIFYKPILSH